MKCKCEPHLILICSSCNSFIVMIIMMTLLQNANSVNVTNGASEVSKINCKSTAEVEECFSNLQPIKVKGIPTNLEEIDNKCSFFHTGMNCVNTWSRQCIKNKIAQEKLNSSIIGGLETYRFLCTDPKFREEFLKYRDCYRKMSNHWDDCSRLFLETLQRVDHSKDDLTRCCIRYRFLHCVNRVINHFCPNGVSFLIKLAHVSVRAEKAHLDPPECRNVSRRNCTIAKTSSFSPSGATTISTFNRDTCLKDLRYYQLVLIVTVSTLLI